MSASPTSAMIFAAGFGTRMKHLTRDRPKPMIPVAGQPLIDRALDLVHALSPDRIAVNLHYKAEVLQAHLAGSDVHLLLETPDILDTGGGLRNALPVLGTYPVYTVNPDAVWAGPNPLQLLAQAWDPEHMDALLVCVPISRAIGRQDGGDFSADDSGRLTRGCDLVYGGVQIVKTGGLLDIPDQVFSLNLLWNRMQADGRLFALEYPGHWCDVGHPEGIALAEDMLRKNAV